MMYLKGSLTGLLHGTDGLKFSHVAPPNRLFAQLDGTIRLWSRRAMTTAAGLTADASSAAIGSEGGRSGLLPAKIPTSKKKINKERDPL